jgi:hypothetical protein
MRNGRGSFRCKSLGAINKVVVAVLAACGIGGTLAYRALRDGASDFSYIFFMSLAGVVAMAIVAPGLFSGGRDRPPWERTRPPKSESSNNSADPK